MPRADATLLPPIPADPSSSRRLDDVGPLAVLGAMVEQKKRASRPAPAELDGDAAVETVEAARVRARAAQRVAHDSDGFLKVR